MFAAVPAAQAQELRLGVQLNGLRPIGANVFGGEAGGHVAVQWPLGDSLAWRATLEGGVGFAPASALTPIVRIDGTFLSRGDVYYGVGAGTGFAFLPASQNGVTENFSPLGLLNAHGIVGKNFGNFALEGILRVGFINSLGLRASFPIR